MDTLLDFAFRNSATLVWDERFIMPFGVVSGAPKCFVKKVNLMDSDTFVLLMTYDISIHTKITWDNNT